MITEPLSLKKLQKAVRGQHGRNDPTGVSEFKSWAQFDEKAQLLWKNAYYYNEEGSEIYAIAQALEVRIPIDFILCFGTRYNTRPEILL